MKAILTSIHGSAAQNDGEQVLESAENQYFSVQNGVLWPIDNAGDSLWVHLKYEPRYAAWQVSSSDGLDLRVNGEPVRSSKILTDGDCLTIFHLQYHIEYEYASPIWNGAEVNSVSLEGLFELVVGREAGAGTGDRHKLGLDKHVLSISREQFSLRLEEGDWYIRNLSEFGTELNSRLILDKQRLVFGDRIKVGDYIFQFESRALRRIDHSESGALLGTDLTVIVPDRSTGQPKRILDSVTVGARQGELVGILGGSGQGKTTLLTALCGLRACSDGKALIGGRSGASLSAEAPGAIGYVPQDDIVHTELIVEGALLFSSRLRQRLGADERRGLVDRMIEVLGLSEHRSKRIDQLSGGQRKRVSIAMALLSKPEVLFLDEPSSGLDPATETKLMELLQSLALNNLTVICTTHVLQNAFLFNRLWFIHEAQLIFSGDAPQARSFFLDQEATVSASQHASVPVPQGQLEKIYTKVLGGQRTGEEWRNEFVRSEAGGIERRFVEKLKSHSSDTEFTTTPQPRSISKFSTLLARQLALLSASKLNLLFLSAQVIVIGLLVSWVSDDAGFRSFLGIIAAMWFGCSNGAQEIVKESAILSRERLCGLGTNTYALSKMAFQGLMASMQAFLLFCVVTIGGNIFHPEDLDVEHFTMLYGERDHPIIADERPVEQSGVDWLPVDENSGGEEMDYPGGEEWADAGEGEEDEVVVPSSFVLWCTTTFQLKENILNSGPKPLTMSDNSPVMGEDNTQVTSAGASVSNVLLTTIGLRVLSYLTAAMVGVALGLAVSTLVQTPIQAVMWVPLLLIPQILFGGFVINVSEMSNAVRAVAVVFPSFSCQRLADVSRLYGREVPSLTNKTKTPQFLTTDGRKEEIKWEESGRSMTQSFEKISDANVAWQNLVIEPSLLGQHKQHRTPGANLGSYYYPESISTRRDVRFDKGTAYLGTQAVFRPLITLGCYALFCYCLIVISLWRRKAI